MSSLLQIIDWKKREIEPLLRPVHSREFEKIGQIKRKGISFFEAINNPSHLAIIAEIKRKSPSSGNIAPFSKTLDQARLYVNACVEAISVITDQKFFGGTIQDLWEVNDFLETRTNPTPTLRKDFMVHPIQILEAAEAGARAILIIVAALSNHEIKALYDAATLANLDSIFEVHNESELERALQFEPYIIGVNNRNLSNFQTDLAVSERLIPQIPDDLLIISESGFRSPEDASFIRSIGADAILVGEALMRSDDVDALVQGFHNA